MATTKSNINLLLMTRYKPIKEQPEQLAAVLQKRGIFNFETGQPQQWPGASEFTIKGEAEVIETIVDAVNRLTERTIGQELGEILRDMHYTTLMKEVYRLENTRGEINIYYAVIMPFGYFRFAYLNISSGGLVPVLENNLPGVININNYFESQTGVDSYKAIAMFKDEIEALKKAFALFKTLL